MARRAKLSSALFCLLVLVSASAFASLGEKSDHIVLMIDHDSHGFVYTMNSEKVTVKDLLLTLSEHRNEHLPEPEVILLVHKEVTLTMVNNVFGILKKAGYAAAPRVFVFDSYKQAMNELNFTYSPRIPFSAVGDVPAKK